MWLWVLKTSENGTLALRLAWKWYPPPPPLNSLVWSHENGRHRWGRNLDAKEWFWTLKCLFLPAVKYPFWPTDGLRSGHSHLDFGILAYTRTRNCLTLHNIDGDACHGIVFQGVQAIYYVNDLQKSLFYRREGPKSSKNASEKHVFIPELARVICNPYFQPNVICFYPNDNL